MLTRQGSAESQLWSGSHKPSNSGVNGSSLQQQQQQSEAQLHQSVPKPPSAITSLQTNSLTNSLIPDATAGSYISFILGELCVYGEQLIPNTSTKLADT